MTKIRLALAHALTESVRAVEPDRFAERIQSPDERRIANRSTTKARHDKHRALGVCINNAAHGPAVKGGRCAACWAYKACKPIDQIHIDLRRKA